MRRRGLAARADAQQAGAGRVLWTLDKTTPEPGDMRAYFMQHVALGNFSCLTHFSILLARLWEDAELPAPAFSVDPASSATQRRAETLHVEFALGGVFAERVAVEGGDKYQLGWLLAGLAEPPFATTSQRKPRAGRAPRGRLAEAQWVAAQLAYLKDLDAMTEHMKKQRGADPATPENK